MSGTDGTGQLFLLQNTSRIVFIGSAFVLYHVVGEDCDRSWATPDELVHESPQEIDGIRCQRFLGGLLRHYYRVAA